MDDRSRPVLRKGSDTARRPSGQIAWWSAWTLLAATIALSLGPEAGSVGGAQPSDKLLHVVLYAPLTLAFLATGGSPDQPRWAKARSVIAVATAIMGLGVLLEGAQALLPYRTAELMDVVANGAGVATGTLAWLASIRCMAPREP